MSGVVLVGWHMGDVLLVTTAVAEGWSIIARLKTDTSVNSRLIFVPPARIRSWRHGQRTENRQAGEPSADAFRMRTTQQSC
jgi:hypothetical protein